MCVYTLFMGGRGLYPEFQVNARRAPQLVTVTNTSCELALVCMPLVMHTDCSSGCLHVHCVQFYVIPLVYSIMLKKGMATIISSRWS